MDETEPILTGEQRLRFRYLWDRRTEGDHPLSEVEESELKALLARLDAAEAAYLRPANARIETEATHLEAQNARLETLIERAEALSDRLRAFLAEARREQQATEREIENVLQAA